MWKSAFTSLFTDGEWGETAALSQEEEKTRIRKALMTATKRKRDSENGGDAELPKKNKNPIKSFVRLGNIENFGKYMRDASLAKIEFKRERMQMEREPCEMERVERYRERKRGRVSEFEKLKPFKETPFKKLIK